MPAHCLVASNGLETFQNKVLLSLGSFSPLARTIFCEFKTELTRIVPRPLVRHSCAGLDSEEATEPSLPHLVNEVRL